MHKPVAALAAAGCAKELLLGLSLHAAVLSVENGCGHSIAHSPLCGQRCCMQPNSTSSGARQAASSFAPPMGLCHPCCPSAASNQQGTLAILALLHAHRSSPARPVQGMLRIADSHDITHFLQLLGFGAIQLCLPLQPSLHELYAEGFARRHI